ncbi:hypothetical protein [Streptomyces sp. KL116D]|uniref:hypothetical protein n=1 Tax=Streptomyces sp. KL116D TaxID=3045152 RepID=UPI0035592677
MTTTHASRPPGRGWLLLALSIALAMVGGWLLLSPPRAVPASSSPGAAGAPPGVASAASGAAAGAGRGAAGPAVRSTPPTATPPTGPSPETELPPRGEGVAGDRAIQQLLDRAWPADLPAEQARPLVTLGRTVLLADLTGLHRAEFPTAFPTAAATGTAVVRPAFSRIRIQAAIARRDPAVPGRAIVHLVWAGADRGGTYTDGRLTDLTFRHAPGDDRWTPLPPTTS